MFENWTIAETRSELPFIKVLDADGDILYLRQDLIERVAVVEGVVTVYGSEQFEDDNYHELHESMTQNFMAWMDNRAFHVQPTNLELEDDGSEEVDEEPAPITDFFKNFGRKCNGN